MDNVLKLIVKDDEYQIFVNGAEIKNITDLKINKCAQEFSEVSLTFLAKVKTKEPHTTYYPTIELEIDGKEFAKAVAAKATHDINGESQ